SSLLGADHDARTAPSCCGFHDIVAPSSFCQSTGSTSMSGDVASTRAKIQNFLTANFNDVSVDKDGDYSLRNGSARIFVNTWTREEVDWTAVSLERALVSGVEESPEVFEHVALHADDYMFGHLNVRRSDDALRICMSHT